MKLRTRNMSCDHQGFCDRRSFLSDSAFNGNFPHEYHNSHSHNPNHPEVTPFEQVRYVVNEASLLASVMVDQHISYTAISYVETLMAIKANLKPA